MPQPVPSSERIIVDINEHPIANMNEMSLEVDDEEVKVQNPEYFAPVDKAGIDPEETCIICFECLIEQEVVKLSCNENHIFHEK